MEPDIDILGVGNSIVIDGECHITFSNDPRILRNGKAVRLDGCEQGVVSVNLSVGTSFRHSASVTKISSPTPVVFKCNAEVQAMNEYNRGIELEEDVPLELHIPVIVVDKLVFGRLIFTKTKNQVQVSWRY